MAKRPAKKPAKKPAPKTSPKAAAKKPAPKPAPKAAPKAVAKPAPARPQPKMAPPPVPPPVPPLPVLKPPAPAAVDALERGMKAIQQHDYSGAAKIFQALVTSHPDEGFLADRARVYLELAQRELRRRSAPASAEERLTAATLALNNHNDREAARLAQGVLDEDRSQDLAAYLLAVVAARAGDVETALGHLRTAIAINPDCRLQARQDEEFDPLLESEAFHEMIEPPAAPSLVPPKRPIRRGSR
jgi:tetratricopeptide (TPR) repeat protein